MTDTTAATATTTASDDATLNRVAWFEIHTADPDRAQAFYGEVLGWTFQPAMPTYHAIEQGDGPISGGMADSGGDYPDDAVFCVHVADVDATLEAVTRAGGSVVAPAQATPQGLRFAYVADPDGSVFGLFTPPT